MNGDGFADLIVGAPGGDDGGNDAGEAYVVFGKASGFGATVDTGGFDRQVIDLTTLSAADGFIIQGDTAGDTAGWSVSVGGRRQRRRLRRPDRRGAGGDDGGATPARPMWCSARRRASATVDTGGFDRQVIDLTTLSAADGFIIQGDTADDHAGCSVSSAGDVNGDGFADLIVGAPSGDDGGNDAGEAYVLFGGAFGASAAPVTTTGSAAAEIFIGGLGNDTLTGGGGADVFHGGAGDDVIIVGDLTFRRVDGGTGTDTLALAGAGLTLDLTDRTLAAKIDGIERIDLTGSGNNTPHARSARGAQRDAGERRRRPHPHRRRQFRRRGDVHRRAVDEGRHHQ